MGLVVREARIHPTGGHRPAPVDVRVEDGAIAAIAPPGRIKPAASDTVLEADGRLLSPPLVDPHVHMDAVLTVGEPRYNESGTLIEGILTWAERKPSLTHEDVKTRAREAILWEVAQGTGFIRSHVDVCDPKLVALRALIELREEVRDIVDLRLIAFPQDGILSFPNGRELMREAMALGCDIIGGIPHYEWTREDGVAEVEFLFELARETGAPIDLHCDETDDEQSRFLEVVAARAIRDGMQGRVVAGHTTAMASYNDNYAFKLIQILKRAGVTIVANPLDNIVLQGRFDTYPKRRGMTRVKELDAAGINVACGHDSIMDPVVPAWPRLDARRAVDAGPRRPDDRPGRALPGLRDGHDQPGQGGRRRVRGEGGWSSELRRVRLRGRGGGDPAAAGRPLGRPEGRVVAETEPAESVVHHAGTDHLVTFTKGEEANT